MVPTDHYRLSMGEASPTQAPPTGEEDNNNSAIRAEESKSLFKLAREKAHMHSHLYASVSHLKHWLMCQTYECRVSQFNAEEHPELHVVWNKTRELLVEM